MSKTCYFFRYVAAFPCIIQDQRIIQTGGYPARNLKEFLNLLEKTNKMRDVPFLYFSDHDVHGHHIFLGLKYGSMASSWASSTQVCSRLQRAGMLD